MSKIVQLKDTEGVSLYPKVLEEYSTTEKIIGRLEDGTLIYKKTYFGTTSSNNIGTYVDTSFNANTIRIIDSGGNISSSTSINQISIGSYVNVDWYSGIHLDGSGLRLYVPNNNNLKNSSYMCWIKYTKTTD